jgi:hypothetical protein
VKQCVNSNNFHIRLAFPMDDCWTVLFELLAGDSKLWEGVQAAKNATTEPSGVVSLWWA